jgi:peptidoglycan/LPS O-acetylase OafA/YrhL
MIGRVVKIAQAQLAFGRLMVTRATSARQATTGPAAAKSYRPDIDGLRAVAVLSVISFHLGHRFFPGGFLGVDIFFVISGYLITSILWREVVDGAFSVVRFYDRRVRRIMPALLAVLAVATVAALLVLLPADLIGYARSLIATLLFVANVYFWRDTDYFARLAEQKPLLHMWSLGIEEQFYILFPLVLLLLRRAPHRIVLTVLGAITVVSFAGNAFALYIGGDSPAFFLLPTRAWELSVGALLALLPRAGPGRTTRASLAGLCGLGLVAVAIVYPLTLLPTLPVATPAVIGAALIIWAGRGGAGAASSVLGWRPLVFVGLISYSLYLWHWPIIVFARYYLVRELTWQEDLLSVPLMIGIAAASWQFIERPFRGSAVPIVKVRALALAGSLALSLIAGVSLAGRGFPQRLNAAAAVLNEAVGTNYRCALGDYLPLGSSRACVVNLPSREPRDADVVLLGNSHMQMYVPVWQRIFTERGRKGLLVPANGCLPTIVANISVDCLSVARRHLAEILALPNVTTVIIGLNWGPEYDLVDATGRPLDNRRVTALIGALDDLLDRVQQSGREVILIGPIAEPGWDVASVLSRQLAFGHPPERPTSVSASDFLARYGPALTHFEGRLGRFFARPDTVQCADGACRYVIGGRSLFADSTHLAAGELDRFRGVFERALPATAPVPAR